MERRAVIRLKGLASSLRRKSPCYLTPRGRYWHSFVPATGDSKSQITVVGLCDMRSVLAARSSATGAKVILDDMSVLCANLPR